MLLEFQLDMWLHSQDYAFLYPLLLGSVNGLSSGQWNISTLDSPLNECLDTCMTIQIIEYYY